MLMIPPQLAQLLIEARQQDLVRAADTHRACRGKGRPLGERRARRRPGWMLIDIGARTRDRTRVSLKRTAARSAAR